MPANPSANLRLLILILASTLPAACITAGDESEDPLRALHETRLPALAGWTARAVMPHGAAPLTRVEALEMFAEETAPALVALDRRGRCWILTPVEGGWSAWQTVHDRRGLTAIAQGEVDARMDRSETFVGGAAGNLYLVGGHARGTVDARLVAQFPGVEIHALLSGDLDPFSKGDELLVFTHPKGTYRVRADGPDGTFTSDQIQGLDVGVRDALLLPFEVGKLPTFASASDSGRIELSSLTPEGPQRAILFDGASAATRLALAPERSGRGPTLYSSLDDGRILRHERRASGNWTTETLHSGPAGPLGLAAGQFDPDPAVETLAVFTADGSVTMLSKRAERWRAQILFEDLERGTWLRAAELDPRNSTDEILACGDAGRVIVLARTAQAPQPPHPAR
ncbi:MAG: hypothetical protein ACI8QZ_003472 [Chlamydiales bacterium]|jgi:hypothetical protein